MGKLIPFQQDGFTAVFLDADYRRNPKTSRFCTMCQKDLVGPAHAIHEVLGGNFALLLSESERYAAAGRSDDLGRQLVGSDCARKLPAGFTAPEAK